MRALSQKLILRKNKLVTILITISLVLYPLFVDAVVSEQQETTYSPDVGWVMPATTTQPAMELAHPQLSVEEKILRAFPDAPIMVEVARCESD